MILQPSPIYLLAMPKHGWNLWHACENLHDYNAIWKKRQHVTLFSQTQM